ncbi:MAG: ABC transporter ATP-binding protein [Candidatus Rokubacteria bacterium]|nr:ABC transporter ATP-binding protein [Candidatus Rokubacteria bacterium]
MLAVEVRDLAKTFRSGWFPRRLTRALRGVNLSIPRGVIFGLLGPNGAGKTTLLSILATLLLPDAGEAKVLGHDVVREARAIRPRLNMASGNSSFIWSLRAPEILAFYGRLYGLHGKALARKVDELVALCELEAHRKVPYTELSTGLKQRLALAKSLVNDPELLFLDEPTLGLDPDISVRMRAQIAGLRRERGTTILLTTHYMREAEELCDEIAFIKNGEIPARGTADALKRQIKIGDVISLRLDPASGEGLTGLPGVLRCVFQDGRVECTVDSADKRLPEILRWLHEQAIVIRDVDVHEPDLEEVFVELAK